MGSSTPDITLNAETLLTESVHLAQNHTPLPLSHQSLLRSRILLFLLSLIFLLLAVAADPAYWLSWLSVSSRNSVNETPLSPMLPIVPTGTEVSKVANAQLSTGARVQYLNPEPGSNPVADTIRQRRAGGELLELDQVLLNSEPIASAWNQLSGTLRGKTKLPADLRELLILRTAALNGATYEWVQHEPEGLASGLTPSHLQTIHSTPAFLRLQPTDESSPLTPVQSSAMLFADWMTKNVYVPKVVYDDFRQFLAGVSVEGGDGDGDGLGEEGVDEMMVEATALVGASLVPSRLTGHSAPTDETTGICTPAKILMTNAIN
ncbi:hypothetical protein BXZ70DRAFT_1003402 [Cristinia sonorae]|uniref:Carboxymuconolactone decarboxylase-like domain-containing protein n=1 Tax=Cristinia sonorae TaxID=1940300 RepID=A0A8K0UYP1_9AGAR|nr:hypothetical protein BXZ70DRAFT_1003402 [Cristinia sonorae]